MPVGSYYIELQEPLVQSAAGDSSFSLHQWLSARVNFTPQGTFSNVWGQFHLSQPEGATQLLVWRGPDTALQTKENLQQGLLLATVSIVLRLRNPALYTENGSQTAWLQNVSIKAPRMFKVEGPFWPSRRASCLVPRWDCGMGSRWVVVSRWAVRLRWGGHETE